MLFALWTGRMHRPTRDLDLLGFGESSATALQAVFRALASVADSEDGLDFAADTITVEPIREDQEYGGQRVRLEVQLANARVALQIDVGFGDAITPAPETVVFPTLLATPAPHLRAYPKETVVAEKLQAMVHLGMANSRMKDFHDLGVLAREFSFAGPVLRDAIAATFARRETAVPADVPVALTETFARDEVKRKQWAAFLKRSGLTDRGGELEEIIAELARFLLPPMSAVARDEAFALIWTPAGPWGAAAAEESPARAP
jgi:hypothetical protein